MISNVTQMISTLYQQINTVDICRYSEKILKHLPAKSLNTIKERLVYNKETVIIPGGRDRRSTTSQTPEDRTDKNLGSRITNFHDLIGQKLYYRISLKYFVDLGLVNFPEKTDTKFIFTLESNMSKLFESNARVDAIPATPDAQIIYHDTPYISYQQISLVKNFQAYFQAMLRSKKALSTGVQFSPYQQSFKVNVDMQTININFQDANRQFAWLEILLVYDKSEPHQTIYDSYNGEVAGTKIQSLTLENTSSTYSFTGGLEYNIHKEDDKHWLCAMFVTYQCGPSCSTAPLTEHANNKIHQDLPKERNLFTNTDEKLYIDMRRSKGYTDKLEKLTRDDSDVTLTVKLKPAATKKMRLRVTGYS